MKIDIFSHILPEKYWATLCKKHEQLVGNKLVACPGLANLDTRFKVMDRNPEVSQVLTIAEIPGLEELVRPADSVELVKIANEELAELVIKYPNRFIGGVANLPLNDIEAALEETDRAIIKLGLKGVQLYVSLFGDYLDQKKYRPLYDKMVAYDLPIWIHPSNSPKSASHKSPNPIEAMPYGLFSWPLATALNMMHLVTDGIFNDYPNIKFITHHCGGVIPYLEGRIRWLYPQSFPIGHPALKWKYHFQQFYTDTAACGATSTLMCGYNFFGADHLLFGTDMPFPSSGLTIETMNSVHRMDIPETEKEKIFAQNAIELLNIAT